MCGSSQERTAIRDRGRTADHLVAGITRQGLSPDGLSERLAADVIRRRLAGVIEYDEVLEGLQHAAGTGGIALFGERCAEDGLASRLMPTRSKRLGQVVPRLGEVEVLAPGVVGTTSDPGTPAPVWFPGWHDLLRRGTLIGSIQAASRQVRARRQSDSGNAAVRSGAGQNRGERLCCETCH